MWDLWWTKWRWDRFFPEYFGFPPLILFNRKNEKTNHLHHNKPQACGASVAFAAGPSTTKKNLSFHESQILVKEQLPHATDMCIEFGLSHKSGRNNLRNQKRSLFHPFNCSSEAIRLHFEALNNKFEIKRRLLSSGT
jgi:hypothetical protein